MFIILQRQLIGMENRPIRPTMKEQYYKDFLKMSLDTGKVSKNDEKVILSYIQHKVVTEHISAATRSNSVIAIVCFKQNFLNGIDLKAVNDDIWVNSIDSLLSSDYTTTTKNGMIATLKTFFRWCVEKKVTSGLTYKSISSIKKIRTSKRTKSAEKDLITSEEVLKMLSYPRVSLCMSALIAVLYWTGCRIGEALNLKWSDIEFNPPVLEVRIPPFKTNPERYVPSAEALPYVANWKNHYPVEVEGGASGDNYVFVSRYRVNEGYKKMTCAAVSASLHTLSEKTIGRKVHPHQFRASDITNKSKAGISDMANKMIHWGHAGTSMLDVYSIPSKDMIKDEILKANGLTEIEETVSKDKPVVCPVCSKINIGVKFCSNCGTPLSREDIEKKALVDEEIARINRNNPIEKLFVGAAEQLGVDVETMMKMFVNAVKIQQNKEK